MKNISPGDTWEDPYIGSIWDFISDIVNRGTWGPETTTCHPRFDGENFQQLFLKKRFWGNFTQNSP